jgi:hypothetical protein
VRFLDSDVRTAYILKNPVVEGVIESADAGRLLEFLFAKLGPDIGAGIAEAIRIPDVVDAFEKNGAILRDPQSDIHGNLLTRKRTARDKSML